MIVGWPAMGYASDLALGPIQWARSNGGGRCKGLKQNGDSMSVMASMIVIPARLAARRLPDKPLADIGGKPMIVRVWEAAMAADLGPVVVAAGDEAILEAVNDHGGRAVMTDPNHPSGSDRVREAVERTDPDGKAELVINLQGDLPTIDPTPIRTAAEVFNAVPDAMLTTLAAEIKDPAERDNPHVVKAVLALPEGETMGRALYFTRAKAPYGDGPLYHHIGLYAYRRAALERFVSLPQSSLEKRERLEQLRALENGMVIGAAVVDTVPLGVDTPEDLAVARAHFERPKPVPPRPVGAPL